MSEKTNAIKHARRHHRKPRKDRRPNPAFGMGIMSNASLIRSVETVAFGEIGCALLRALKITPWKLLAVPDDRDDTPQDLEAEETEA
jgi:hypothetical protein